MGGSNPAPCTGEVLGLALLFGAQRLFENAYRHRSDGKIVQRVDVDTVDHTYIRSVGAEHAPPFSCPPYLLHICKLFPMTLFSLENISVVS
jgi:hypothetical protein